MTHRKKRKTCTIIGQLTVIQLMQQGLRCILLQLNSSKRNKIQFFAPKQRMTTIVIAQPQRHAYETHKTRNKLEMAEDWTWREIFGKRDCGGASGNLHEVSAVITDATIQHESYACTPTTFFRTFPVKFELTICLRQALDFQISLFLEMKNWNFQDFKHQRRIIFISDFYKPSETYFDSDNNITQFPAICNSDFTQLTPKRCGKVPAVQKAFSEEPYRDEDDTQITPSRDYLNDSLASEEFSVGFRESVQAKNSANVEGTEQSLLHLNDENLANTRNDVFINDFFERDGSIYDRARDPPGQRSVYVPPGNEKQESYRLSTFSKFPQDVPVIPRDLAGAGFLYTGYKDRVKCFSCGLCVENWVVGDDVKHARWHKSTCDFINGRECGNIPIGGALFSRFFNRPAGANVPESNSGSRSGPLQPPQPRAPQAPQEAPEPMEEGNLNVVSTHSATPVPLPAPNYLTNNFRYADMPSIEHSNYVKSLDLKHERNRRLTFRNWPEGERTVSINELAKSGFFYLGNLDRVQCFSCAGVLRNWALGDIVDNEHRRHFGHCRMLRGAEMMNVPIINEERPAAVGAVQEPADPIPSLTEGLREMFPCIDPVSPHMRDEARRLETFDQRWPNRIAATPAQIAKAGFFFLGERDRVKCWYCNGGLQNWDTDDEPWTEHAKWFPTCEFILQKKGPDFVHRIVAQFPNLRRPVIQRPYDIPPNEELGPAAQRHPSPPPPIIDPQEDERRLNEKVEAAMRGHVVQSVVGMGYSENNVKNALRRKIRNSRAEFGTEGELIDALENHEYSDDEEPTSGPTNINISNVAAQNVVIGNRRLQNTVGSVQLPTTETTTIKQTPSAPASITPMDVEQSGATTSLSSSEEQTPSMVRRLRELQEERICKICLDKPADMVFVPCGHLCCCYNCASSVRKCPVCRKKIDTVIRTYLS